MNKWVKKGRGAFRREYRAVCDPANADTVFRWNVLRGVVWTRDRRTCAICLRRITLADYELGHWHDRVAGGLDTPRNVAVMCGTCPST